MEAWMETLVLSSRLQSRGCVLEINIDMEDEPKSSISRNPTNCN